MAKWSGDGFQSDARTTDIAPRSLTLVTEQPYASATGVKRDPASWTVKLWAPAGASTAEGRARVTRGAAFVAALGAYPGAPGTYSCLWLGPSSTETNGATAAVFADGVANTYLNVTAGGAVGLAIGGGDQLYLIAASISLTPPILQWKSTVVAPKLMQATHATTPQTMTLQAMNVTTGIGSDLHLTSGTGSTRDGATRLRVGGETMAEVCEVAAGQRVVALCRGSDLTTTQMPANSGDRVAYIGECATAPTAAPVSGHTLFVQGGALKGYGTSGTVTTIAAAEPHCPRCGNDYVFEARNDKRGHHVAICWTCFLDTCTRHGIERSDFAFIDRLGKAA